MVTGATNPKIKVKVLEASVLRITFQKSFPEKKYSNHWNPTNSLENRVLQKFPNVGLKFTNAIYKPTIGI